MAKPLNAHDPKSCGRKPLRVGLPPPAPIPSSSKPLYENAYLLAYVTGLALGDGNLSNPNGRSTRLRITCDTRYPKLITKIRRSIRALLPNNKVSIVRKDGNCIDISCYSNHWERILGWRAGGGSKIVQHVSVPSWIKDSDQYKVHCLRGLVETDGCIYIDRGYPMVMFASAIPSLARDVQEMIRSLDFGSHLYKIVRKGHRGRPIYRVKLSKKVQDFLTLVRPEKR